MLPTGIKDPKKVAGTANLADLGMDSLMGAEIKQTLERNFDLVFGVQDIRNLTFAKLSELGINRHTYYQIVIGSQYVCTLIKILISADIYISICVAKLMKIDYPKNYFNDISTPLEAFGRETLKFIIA